jgi:ligand-binding SRPBCC domain-containing protein
MPKIHQIHREQIIDTDIATAWEFICSPKNLDAITPDDMSFEIVSAVPDKMYDGLLIEYCVGIPILGRQTWLTELKHIVLQRSFVDEQRVGPYQFWSHYHEITAVPGGVRFVDRVHYVLPFGPLGAIAQGLYVKRQLQHVFDYRATAMRKQFLNFQLA